MLTLTLLLSNALAAPAAWYGAPPIEAAWWEEVDASPGQVEQLARRADLRQVRVTREGSEAEAVWTPRRDRLDALGPHELDLLSLALRVDDGVGVEMDLLSPDAGGWRAMTATWSPDGVLDLIVGPVVTIERPGPIHRDALRSAYLLGPVVDEDLSWTPHELGLLGAALDLLDDAERARVAGVAFHRRSSPSEAPLVAPPPGTELEAMTVGGEHGLRVEVLSGGLTSGFRFVGPVSAPRPFALHGLVHELGHVVAAAPDVSRVQQMRAEVEGYEADRGRHAAEVEAFNRAVTEARTLAQPEPEAMRGLHERHAQVLRDQQALEARRRMLDVQVAELTALHAGRQPAVEAWTDFLAGRPAPTLYGRMADVEGFADGFALWKLDPDALERAVPGAVAWFASGAHLTTAVH